LPKIIAISYLKRQKKVCCKKPIKDAIPLLLLQGMIMKINISMAEKSR